MAQSSVEWLVERIKKDTNLRLRGFNIDGMAEQAKAMHKEEHKNAFKGGVYWNTDMLPIDPNRYDEDAEKYYNETFNNETP